MGNKLSPLQVRVIEALSDLDPPWTLTGGAALVGFHLHHRITRDLDLFLYGRSALDDYADRVIDTLRAAGIDAVSQQTGTAMHRLLVTEKGESTVLDLVADPVPTIEAPVERSLGGSKIRVDSKHEILVNKLCTLVQRSEIRDLIDVRELLAQGGDLLRALSDAPKKDGGFSPLTLVWLLGQLSIEAIGEAEGLTPEETRGLEQFRDSLVATLSELTLPGDDPGSSKAPRR